MVPAGGLASDHERWLRPKYNFFLPVDALSVVFRAKFVEGLRAAYRNRQLQFCGSTVELHKPKQFHAFIDALFNQKWVVYAKPAFGGPRQVLKYLGRYTHRVAISNHRLLAFDGDRVTFRWKDYAHRNKQRQMTLAATEFLRRFVQHILPRGFVRIRHFGFLTNSRRSVLLALARQLLTAEANFRETGLAAAPSNTTWRCPLCHAPMRIGPNLTASQLIWQCRPIDSS